MRQAVKLQPTLPRAWLNLAALFDRNGERKMAANAYLMHARSGVHDAQLMAAGDALSQGRLPEAESMLRERLRAYPNDVAAMRVLAELAVRVGRNEQALALLEQCLALAPGFVMARHHYALVLDRSNRYEDALAELEGMLAEGGLFAFTVELLQGEGGFALQPTRRFAHSRSYVMDRLAESGLSALSVGTDVIRLDRGQPVEGLFVVAARG